MAKLAKKHSFVELNRVVSRFTGDLKDQYPMSSATEYLENGQPVIVDDMSRTVSKLGNEASVIHRPKNIYLHYSEEKTYDGSALENFVLYQDTPEKRQPLPRCYKLTVGDTFTTDAVDVDPALLETMNEEIKGNKEFIVEPDGTSGLWKVSEGPPTNEFDVVGIVQKVTTAPNGVDPAIKIAIVKA